MERTRFIALSVAYVLVIGTIAGLSLPFGPGVVAASNHTTDASTYAVGQDGRCILVHPIGDGTETGPEYYDYRSPETDPNSSKYSSFGTSDVQRADVSQVYVHAGSDGDNLVVLHDEMDDEGDNGGAVTFDIAGLPPSGNWTVEDDDYSGQDDRFNHDETTSEMNWMWEDDRTDGGVFNRLDGDDWEEITIDPAFREESWAWTEREPRWPHADEGPNEWIARDGQGDEMSLDMTEIVSVRKGTCEAVTTTADLRAPSTVSTGDNVTLDASNSTSETAIVEYRWDLTNDGSVDRRTETATIDHSYEQPGNVTASVTVVDRFGNEENATADVDVEAVGDPKASLTVPSNASVGSTVTLDASNSSDDEGITEYRWSFGDGTASANSSNATITHVYDTPGTYGPNVTVIDADGNTDTANATITIDEEDSPPGATLSAPEEISPNESITLDATNSTDDRGIVEYRWTVDGEPLEGANGSTTNTAFTDPGDHEVAVTVVDESGNEATANASIYVFDETPPEASLSVPSNATVGSTVTLDASNSSDNVGVDSYRWAFGDNSSETSSRTPRIDHTYESPGTYTPRVTVVDRDGNTDTANATITVESATALTATFSINESTPQVGEPISVDGSNSTVESPNASYHWEFGDGSTSSGETATHAYGTAGNYTVSLTVADGNGNDDTQATVVTVTEANNGSDDGSDSSDDSDNGNGDSGGDSSNGGSGGGGNGGSSAGGSSSGGGSSSNAGTSDRGAEPAIVVTNVTSDHRRTVVDEPISVNATVENEGDATGSKTLSLTVERQVVDRREVTLAGGESRVVTFTTKLDTTGEHVLQVDNSTATVTVDPREADIAVVDVWLEEETIQAGDRATIVTAVTNDGGVAGKNTVTLTVFDEVVDRKTVEVPPGERRTVHFSQQFDSPGTYEIDISGRRASVEVTGDSTSTAFTMEEPNGTDRSTSLGYMGIGGLVLAAAAIFASRRL